MSIVTIKDGSGDEIQIEGDRNGGLDITVQDDVDGTNYRMACFNRPEALKVAAAIYSALGEFVPAQPAPKGPDGYIVRRGDQTLDASSTNHQIPPQYLRNLNQQPNFFATLDAAKAAASEWAAKYKRAYTVFAFTEIGTAAPSAPPVSWTEK